MPLRHNSPTQKVPETGFQPLMRNEVPYYENLNRPAKSAYTYANLVNLYMSYGGYISVLQPGVDSHIHEFSLYEIVRITDEELAMPAILDEAGTEHARYGIVVCEAEIDPVTNIRKNLVVCTFCPNFVYPDKTLDTVWASQPGGPLYLSTNAAGMYLSASPSTVQATTIGSVPIARRVGKSSIFFSGTLRSLTR